MSMIEKLTRAIEQELDVVEMVDASQADLRRMRAKRIARAVLQVMRDPDEQMRRVLTEADWNEWPAGSAYVVAIDKALEPVA